MKFVSVVLMTLSLNVFAGENHHAPAKVSPEFENMKALLGTWEGVSDMTGKEEPFKVTYELTSGGTAIIEKLHPGTPMEMVTVYANNGKTVNATHFCAAGNQPQLALKKAKDGVFTFEMVGTKGISNKNEMHMHAVTLTLQGNKLKQEWVNFKNGKKDGTHIFEMTKKI